MEAVTFSAFGEPVTGYMAEIGADGRQLVAQLHAAKSYIDGSPPMRARGPGDLHELLLCAPDGAPVYSIPFKGLCGFTLLSWFYVLPPIEGATGAQWWMQDATGTGHRIAGFDKYAMRSAVEDIEAARAGGYATPEGWQRIRTRAAVRQAIDEPWIARTRLPQSKAVRRLAQAAYSDWRRYCRHLTIARQERAA